MPNQLNQEAVRDAQSSRSFCHPDHARCSVPDKQMAPNTASSRTLLSLFGLDVRAAMLTIIVDLMLFGGDLLTLGALIPVAILVGGVVGFIVYKMQIQHGDDHESALIKSLICGLLTAIPTPIACMAAIPGGVIGIIEAIRRK